ncbi:sigma-70 family RNA polymerase sigma factor [Blastopirellula sp. JC732]|uniref:Sigma-70 family RNA polymerase sigma factor n=1 Tax=Blastopirellula sediminis TaxID=2894196 RepID=A0A9X1MNY7_9BACT|nr:sigma-70 family RNA polymerase sigma factor [Blastopirellula sediminis]MCC9607037.1 sigma-70 family RNA polymerase sigma factor [Blastopirellula sediminis]MCC9629670.1 sigma-70 family RNA polymerase sigma factor [Blastopirellula sediminis]
MSEVSETDVLLIDRIRTGDADAWTDLIGRYEGRLLAFAESRLRRRAPSEDVVQETFIGFLNSLPNYDGKRSLESYLFAICAYKLTDHLRREGRRPTLPIHSSGEGSSDNWELPGPQRAASSIVRSGERRDLEEAALVEAIQGQIEHWRSRGDWVKIQCLELLLVRGYANKDVADLLGLTEQNVANYKFDFLAKLRAAVRKQGLNEEIFPELYASN